MTLLNKLMETCVTQKVANLKQDRIAQALEITKLKQRVKRGCIQTREKIAELDAYEDVTLVDVDVEVAMDANIQERMAESQAMAYNLDLQHSETVLSMHDTNELEPAEVEEVIEVVITAKLMIEVVTTAAQVSKPSAPRKRRDVVIQDPKETSAAAIIVHSEIKSKDKGKGILIEEPKPLKRQAQIKHDEAFARQLEAELNANINWNEVIEQVQRKEKQDNVVMRYQTLKKKPLTEAQVRKNMMIYLKNMAGFKMDFFKEKEDEDVTVQQKRQGEHLEQDIAKKQRIDEEAKELKTHL
nr:hypothetical protein [Tanacetum cinerariifolium]